MTNLLLGLRNETFLKNIITSESKWVFFDNVQCKILWIDEDESPQHITKVELHGRKVMLLYSEIIMVLFILSF